MGIGRRVLVVGGRGMLGQMVLRRLSGSAGLEVAYTARNDAPGSVEFEIDTGISALAQLLADLAPLDCIVNCTGVLAGMIDVGNPSSVRRAIMVNSLFPHDLAIAAVAIGAHVIHISTDAVFADDAGPCDEASLRFGTGLYATSKRIGEIAAVHALNLRCSIIGPDTVKRRGLLEWLRAQPAGARIEGFTDQHWNGVTTLQLADLCARLVDPTLFRAVRDEGPVHHVAPNRGVSKFELLGLLAHALSLSIHIVPKPSGHPVNRPLVSRYETLAALLGRDDPIATALEKLAPLCQV
jgi:dTDP-4-dehydrorhamnose reductase